jgi:hypothetical protein
MHLHSGLLDTLNEMNTKLEEIQKSLDMYLETKRQIFPRFYFLSNDDLLEILGQSKNPDAVSDLLLLPIISHHPFPGMDSKRLMGV